MTVAYLRVSTSKQCLKNQKNEIERFACSKGLSIDRWRMETISGTLSSSERMLGQMLKPLKKDDVIVVSEISRLSRKMLEIMSIFHLCIEKGITLYSIKEGYEFGNTMNSKIMGFAFGISAEIERNLISLRTKEALAQRKSQGVVLGRPQGSCVRQHHLQQYQTEILGMIEQQEPLSHIARRYGVARNTLYTFLKKRKGESGEDKKVKSEDESAKRRIIKVPSRIE